MKPEIQQIITDKSYKKLLNLRQHLETLIKSNRTSIYWLEVLT